MDIAGCVPVRVAPKLPDTVGCDQVLRHIACPLTVNASIRAVPERMLPLMSLLKSGLLWGRFGDWLAITMQAPWRKACRKDKTA
jgi:hypothetical protein